LFEQNGYFSDRQGDDPEEILKLYFNQVNWPPEFDGRWFLNGPLRIWSNNEIAKHIQEYVSKKQMSRIVHSLQDNGDQVDIHYPNEILWPKVYDLFSSEQEVVSLYPW
jgi:hypothetical protein